MKYQTRLGSIFLLLVSLPLHATDNSFGKNTTSRAPFSASEIRDRFTLTGDIFVLDAKSGALLQQGKESRVWKFGKEGDIESNWSFESPDTGVIAIKHTWHLDSKGKVSVNIVQYESMKRKGPGRDVETGKEIKKEAFDLKNFESITLTISDVNNRKVVVRFTPSMSEPITPIEVTGYPLSLELPVIYDNTGNVWARTDHLEGKYLSVKTHKGEILFSTSHFKGATPIGVASESEIALNGDKGEKIYIRSSRPIVSGAAPIQIFGRINTKHKSEHLNSVYSSSSNEEKRFLKRFQ